VRRYVQFLYLQDGELQEACGSDGVFILDGRDRMSTSRIDAYLRMDLLKKVHPEYCGYRIYNGSRFGEGDRVAQWVNSEHYFVEY